MNFEKDRQVDKRLSHLFSVTDKNALGPDKELLDRLREESTTEFLASSTNDVKKPKIKTHIPLWRIIMKSNLTKLAAATLIVVVIGFSVSLLDKTTPSTYAVEQTIEAMHQVTTVHCFINTITGERIELWSEINPETGLNEKFYIDGPEETQVATPIETYTYDKKSNIVEQTKGSLARNDLRFGRFIEDLVGIAKAMNADIQIKHEEIEDKKQVILLVMETDQFTFESRIDPDTKLPISMHFKPMGEPKPGQIGQSIEDFTFNAPLPEGIFEFKIPEGAKVIEQ